MVWRLLLHEYHYSPHVAEDTFVQLVGQADAKTAVLIDVLRLIEAHHNRLADLAGQAALHEQQKRQWLAPPPSSPAAPSSTASAASGGGWAMRKRRIRLSPDESVADACRTLSPRVPPVEGKAPGRSIYKGAARHEVPPPEDGHPRVEGLMGGRQITASEAMSLDEGTDDSIVKRDRVDHPEYASAVVGGGPLLLTRGGCSIPDTHTALLTCQDGFPLVTATNCGLSPTMRFSTSHDDTAFSIMSLKESAAAAAAASAAGSTAASQQNPLLFKRRPHGDGVAAAGVPGTPDPPLHYVKKFSAMLERAVVKRLKRVAPCSCRRERREMLSLFKKHGTTAPVESGSEPRGYWAERGRIMEKLKRQLAIKYKGYRVVYGERPPGHGSGTDNTDGEISPLGPPSADGLLGTTLTTHQMNHVERRECVAHKSVVSGMRYSTACPLLRKAPHDVPLPPPPPPPPRATAGFDTLEDGQVFVSSDSASASVSASASASTAAAATTSSLHPALCTTSLSLVPLLNSSDDCGETGKQPAASRETVQTADMSGALPGVAKQLAALTQAVEALSQRVSGLEGGVATQLRECTDTVRHVADVLLAYSTTHAHDTRCTAASGGSSSFFRSATATATATLETSTLESPPRRAASAAQLQQKQRASSVPPLWRTDSSGAFDLGTSQSSASASSAATRRLRRKTLGQRLVDIRSTAGQPV